MWGGAEEPTINNYYGILNMFKKKGVNRPRPIAVFPINLKMNKTWLQPRLSVAVHPVKSLAIQWYIMQYFLNKRVDTCKCGWNNFLFEKL